LKPHSLKSFSIDCQSLIFFKRPGVFIIFINEKKYLNFKEYLQTRYDYIKIIFSGF